MKAETHHEETIQSGTCNCDSVTLMRTLLCIRRSTQEGLTKYEDMSRSLSTESPRRCVAFIGMRIAVSGVDTEGCWNCRLGLKIRLVGLEHISDHCHYTLVKHTQQQVIDR